MQDIVNTLLELFYIISKVFESVHKVRIDVGRGLLSLAETKWLRLKARNNLTYAKLS